ncbi:MAG: FecR domain-containing protein [Arenicellales bacterium]|nr:FecR domain-containing protein [Arenicellales bacterium]
MRSEKNAVRDSGQNAKQKRIGVWVNALLLSIVVGSPVYSATVETEVGVTAVSVTNAVGKPPISPARDLETGLEVFFNEKITTNASGRAQLLFRDGTSLTVGSSSEMTIDEYVFDPDTDTGELVINISKGIFRLVGGKISKNTPVVFNTKTATVTLRGGIGGLTVSNEGVEARNHFGHMTMQNKLTGLTNETFKSGNALRLKPGALTAPTKQKIDPEKLAAMSSALERPVKKRSSAAEEPTTAPQPTESETAASQAEEGQAETDQPEAAGTEPTAQPSQEEKVDSLPTEPGADTEVATVESQVDTEGIPPEPGEASEPLAGQVGDQALVTKAQPDRDEPPVMADPKNLSSDPLPAGEVTVSKGVPAPDMGTKLDINVLVVDLNSDVSPSTMGHEPGMTIDNIAVVVDAITKAPGVKTDEGKPVTNPMPTDEIIGATNPGQKPGKPPVEPCDPAKEKCDGEEEPPVEPCDPSCEGEEDPPVPSSSGSKRDRSMAMIYREGSRLHISSTVTTKGAMLVLSSDYRHLCRVCSYLEWRRDVLWPTGRKPDMASIRYWLSGVSTTQAELAAAASKTAQYSGGLFGNVSTVGHITEKLGHFDAKVRFGVSHYQIQHFNAAFDGRNYLGNSAITPNNALFSAIGSSGKRQMSAQGYFFGNPARGTPPPEIGGHFQITGGGYDAGGIFAGARH